MYKLFPYNEKK